jgi:hypothetical protein
MLQRSIILPIAGTARAEQMPPTDSAKDAVLRCHPISAMIGFKNTPKVKPSTGPLQTKRPATAPTTTHHGFVKLRRSSPSRAAMAMTPDPQMARDLGLTLN